MLIIDFIRVSLNCYSKSCFLYGKIKLPHLFYYTVAWNSIYHLRKNKDLFIEAKLDYNSVLWLEILSTVKDKLINNLKKKRKKEIHKFQ